MIDQQYFLIIQESKVKQNWLLIELWKGLVKFILYFYTWMLIGRPGSLALLRPIGTTVEGKPTALNTAW